MHVRRFDCRSGQIDWKDALASRKLFTLILPLALPFLNIGTESRSVVPSERTCTPNVTTREGFEGRVLPGVPLSVLPKSCQKAVREIFSTGRHNLHTGPCWRYLEQCLHSFAVCATIGPSSRILPSEPFWGWSLKALRSFSGFSCLLRECWGSVLS
jgi:hypothetical protein